MKVHVVEYFVSCIYSFDIVWRARGVFGDYETGVRQSRSTRHVQANERNVQQQSIKSISQSIKKSNSESNRTHI